MAQASGPPGRRVLLVEDEASILRGLSDVLRFRGYTVLGDERYGDAPSNRHFALAHGLDRTFLHLERLELVHPQGGAPLVLESALAPDLAAVLEALRATRTTPSAR